VEVGLRAGKAVDAFHILTAERAGLDAFLTTDRRLINTVRAATNWRFRVRVLSPVELADALGSDA
jgi:predicted nucleic acid-binding protein